MKSLTLSLLTFSLLALSAVAADPAAPRGGICRAEFHFAQPRKGRRFRSTNSRGSGSYCISIQRTSRVRLHRRGAQLSARHR